MISRGETQAFFSSAPISHKPLSSEVSTKAKNIIDISGAFYYHRAMKIKSMVRISIFAVMSAVGAKLMIPVPFVPFTLQTLVCILAGLLLGARDGAAALLVYMLMGLVGVPVFTSAAGPGAIFMPSFGYVIGFVACAWVSGAVEERLRAASGKTTVGGCFAAGLAGLAVMYAIGVAYLYVILNFWLKTPDATIFKVLSIGFFSTAGGDLAKALIASVVAVRLSRSEIMK